MTQSRDDESTKELQALPNNQESIPPDPRACKTCHGNGVIATDSNIIPCPRCKGSKIDPTLQGDADAIKQ